MKEIIKLLEQDEEILWSAQYKNRAYCITSKRVLIHCKMRSSGLRGPSLFFNKNQYFYLKDGNIINSIEIDSKSDVYSINLARIKAIGFFKKKRILGLTVHFMFFTVYQKRGSIMFLKLNELEFSKLEDIIIHKFSFQFVREDNNGRFYLRPDANEGDFRFIEPLDLSVKNNRFTKIGKNMTIISFITLLIGLLSLLTFIPLAFLFLILVPTSTVFLIIGIILYLSKYITKLLEIRKEIELPF